MQSILRRASALYAGLDAGVFTLAGFALLNALSMSSNSFLSLYLTAHRHIEASVVGQLISLRGLAAIAGAYIIGYVIDYGGPRKTLAVAYVLCAAGYLTLASSGAAPVVGGALVAVALARTAFRPAYNVHLSSITAESDRGRAYSLFVMGLNGGSALASTIGGIIISIVPAAVFMWDAALCLVAALVAMVLLRSQYPITEQKQTQVPEERSQRGTRSEFLILCALYFFIEISESLSFFALPIRIVNELGYSPNIWGYMMATLGISVFSLSLLASNYAKRHDQRWVIMISCIAMCLGLAVAGLASSSALLALGWLAFCIAQVFVYPALMQRLLSTIGDNNKARSISFYYSWSSVASTVGPLLAGWAISDQSAVRVPAFCGLAAVVCGILGVLLLSSKPRSESVVT